MQGMLGGLVGLQTLVQLPQCLVIYTKQLAARVKFEVLLPMLQTTMLGLLQPVPRTLKEIRTATRRNISMPWHPSLLQLASQLISLLTLVSSLSSINYLLQSLSTVSARNGVQPTSQQAWGDWCNVMGTGFGVRPTTNTGDALEDAFVWVKPGGECDVRCPCSNSRRS